MRKLFLLLIIFTGITTISPAQSATLVKGEISGIVQEPGQKSLPGATVLLMAAKDSAVIKTAITSEKGRFSFSGIAHGQYILSVFFTGYQKYITPSLTISADSPVYAAEAIILHPAAGKDLAEVTVTSRKPLIEMQADKLVFNVKNSIAATGNTALEVLQKAPGVAIDQNDEISVNGKSGILVYIDGKPTYLSKSDLLMLLRNMRSEQMEKLEIITNPSARYDAAGKAVINIITSKSKELGTNGSFNLGAGAGISPTVVASEAKGVLQYKNEGILPRYNAGLNLNNRKGKRNIFGNVNFNRFLGAGNSTAVRQISGTNYEQYSYSQSLSRNFNYKTGIDFYLDPATTLGFLASGNIGQFENPVPTVSNSYIKNASGALQSSPLSTSSAFNSWSNNTFNVNLRHVDSTGKELLLDVDYALYRTKAGERGLETRFLDANGSEYGARLNITSNIPTVYNILAGKFSYSLPFPKSKSKLEIGGKTAFVKSDNDFRFFNNGVTDAGRTNHFIYSEQIHALYGMYDRAINKTWQVQAGLRIEYTRTAGNSVTLSQTIQNNYFNLFPSLFVKQVVNTQNEITYSYSRRINRPAYNTLNPFVYFLDPYTYTLGNEKLKPSFTNSFAVTYTINHSIVLNANYNSTENYIAQVYKNAVDDPAVYAKLSASSAGTNVDPSKITYLTTENLNKFEVSNISISFPVVINRWWNLSSNTGLIYVAYNGSISSTALNTQTFAYNFFVSQTFKLPKSFTLETSVSYNSKTIYGQIHAREQYSVNFGARKTIMAGQGVLSFSANDIFATNRFIGIVNSNGVILDNRNKSTSRALNLSFSYRFGSAQIKAARNRALATDDERNRIR